MMLFYWNTPLQRLFVMTMTITTSWRRQPLTTLQHQLALAMVDNTVYHWQWLTTPCCTIGNGCQHSVPLTMVGNTVYYWQWPTTPHTIGNSWQCILPLVMVGNHVPLTMVGNAATILYDTCNKWQHYNILSIGNSWWPQLTSTLLHWIKVTNEYTPVIRWPGNPFTSPVSTAQHVFEYTILAESAEPCHAITANQEYNVPNVKSLEICNCNPY